MTFERVIKHTNASVRLALAKWKKSVVSFSLSDTSRKYIISQLLNARSQAKTTAIRDALRAFKLNNAKQKSKQLFFRNLLGTKIGLMMSVSGGGDGALTDCTGGGM